MKEIQGGKMADYHYCETVHCVPPTDGPWELHKAFEVGGASHFVWRLDTRMHQLREAQVNLVRSREVVYWLLYVILSLPPRMVERIGAKLEDHAPMGLDIVKLMSEFSRESTKSGGGRTDEILRAALEVGIPLPTMKGFHQTGRR